MPGPQDDYYARLGVSPQATEREIKAAYRALAKKLHPDLGGDAARLAAVNEAADVLLDETRRGAYDFERKRAQAGQPGSAPRPPGGARKAGEPAKGGARTSVALCEACGALNRVKGDPRVVPASCGQCGHALGTPAGRAPEEAGVARPPRTEEMARCPHCQMRNRVTVPPGAAMRCLGCSESFIPGEADAAESVGSLLTDVSRAIFGTDGKRASARGLAYLEGQLRALADEARRRRERLEREG